MATNLLCSRLTRDRFTGDQLFVVNSPPPLWNASRRPPVLMLPAGVYAWEPIRTVGCVVVSKFSWKLVVELISYKLYTGWKKALAEMEKGKLRTFLAETCLAPLSDYLGRPAFTIH